MVAGKEFALVHPKKLSYCAPVFGATTRIPANNPTHLGIAQAQCHGKASLSHFSPTKSQFQFLLHALEFALRRKDLHSSLEAVKRFGRNS